MDARILQLTPLSQLSELRLRHSPIDERPTPVPAAPVVTKPLAAQSIPIAPPPAANVPVFEEAPATAAACAIAARNAVHDAMTRAVDGMGSIRILFGDKGEPQVRKELGLGADVVISDPHNSPHRVRLDQIEDTPANRNQPDFRTMSAAMAEMQATGKYPTLQDQMDGKGPMGTLGF